MTTPGGLSSTRNATSGPSTVWGCTSTRPTPKATTGVGCGRSGSTSLTKHTGSVRRCRNGPTGRRLPRRSYPHPLSPGQLGYYNTGNPYAEQVKPFNFVLTVTERNTISDERPERLLAPYATDPKRWTAGEWHKLYDPESPPVHISTGEQPEPKEIIVQSFRKVIDHYRTHPEEKAADSAGSPCRPQTRGVLSRRTVRVARFVHIGKESNRIEDQLNGLIENIDEVVTDYGDGDDHLRQLTTAALADLSSRQVVESVESDARRIESP